MKRWVGLILTVAGCLGLGCSSDDNSPPSLVAVGPQTAYVGTELKVALRATDPDGDKVTFKSFKADHDDISGRASLQQGAGANAEFKWLPIGSDVGTHEVTFSIFDGHGTGKGKITVDVKSSVGTAGTPIFRKPLGTGTTLDLASKTCVDVPIEIEDSDSTDVQIGQEPPLVEGATIDQSGPMNGTWHWCPTPEQISGSDLYQLVLSAYDQQNPKVLKTFLVVLQKKPKLDCPGPAPLIGHQPQSQSTTLDLEIQANIGDDKGLKFDPQLLYSATDPGPNPDLASMTQVTMELVSGDKVAGDWVGTIPNPVVNDPPGSTATIYYLIVANDNDDEAGDCDHVTYSPEIGTHVMDVTNSGGSGGLEPCEGCTADAQCGGPDDLCIWIGTDSYCGRACVDSFDCPPSFECSPGALMSVDGKTARQCVPTSSSCTGSGTLCTDDPYEDNDVLSEVDTAPGLPAGSYDLMSCPGAVLDDEDWYPIELSAESNVSVTLTGGSASNLDLFLKDSTGKTLVSSAKTGSSESISTCLQAGRYYFHVWAWSKAENPYTLSWSKTSGCSAQCVDDSNEQDDNATQARNVSLGSAYKSTAQQICSADDDWYEVYMFSGETLKATLKFTQTKSTEDLDLYVYDSASVQLTKCTEADPFDCDSANGQSSTSNENLSYPITKNGTYYVVVHGWDGSENDYDICIDYTSSSKTSNGCPPL